MKRIYFLLTFVCILSCISCTAQPRGRGFGHGGHGGPGGIDKSSDSVLTALKEETLGKFQQLIFEDSQTGGTMGYNLLVPEGYDTNGSTTYPLVMFMADMSTCGSDVTASLTQGYGALLFASDRDQQEHPAFVLVPNYTAKAVDDNWNRTNEVDMTIRLLKSIMQSYRVDADRVYTTGQSMGGMMSFYFNAYYGDLFAASLFVGSQWNIDDLKEFGTRKFFYVVAGGDDKASAGMASLRSLLATQGVTPSEDTWSATLDRDTQDARCEAMISKGNPINFITFTKGSVLENGGNFEHMASFDYAYKLTPVRDWLFRQSR